MSGNLQEKIRIIKGFDQKHSEVLNALMSDKNFKIPLLADKLGYQVSTVRNFLTDIYKTCGVPEGEEDKRGWVVREYSEAYLKKDLPSEPEIEVIKPEVKKPEVKKSETPVVSKPKKRPSQPKINVAPPPARINRTPIVVIGVIATIALIIFVVLNNRPPQSPNQANNSGTHGWYENVNLKDGVTISGSYFAMRDCNTSGDSFSTDLVVQNSSGSDFSMGVSQSMFSLVDSNGKSYPIISAEMVGGGTIYSSHAGQIVLCWEGRSPDQTGVDYVDLTIMNLPGTYDIVFRKTR